jgi:single-stranded DNA-binding protein
MNSHFIGRIGKDGAKVIEGKNGKFLSMDVATDYYSRGENRTLWIRVRSNIPRYVEKLVPHLTKGSLITVEGQQLEPSTWIGKDGEAHAQIVIVANFIDFVRTGKKKDESNSNQTTAQGQPVTVEEQQQDAPFPAPADNNDDLPF